jgi:phosphatidylserine synthase
MSTAADRPVRTAITHPEEWFSILLALIATGAASLFVAYFPNYEPESGGYWVIPVWCGFIYLILQLTFLLFSANEVWAIAVFDSALAGMPVLAGLVMLSELLINKNFHLSNFQLSTLAVLIITGASEFLLMISIRFIINRRTIGFGR